MKPNLSASFDRYDICEAYAVLESDWNRGGWLPERPSCRRRMEAVAVQLHRLGFKPHCNLEFRTLTRNGRAIYLNASRTLKLRN